MRIYCVVILSYKTQDQGFGVTFNCKVLRQHWLLITTYVIYLRKEHGVEQLMYMFITGYKLMNIRDVLKISLAFVRVEFTCYRDGHVN